MELKVNDPKLIEAIFNGDAPDIYFAPDVDTLISEKDALIAELKSEADKVIAKKDAEIAELKKKLMPCLNGDCILTCEVVEKYGKENAELKAEIESLKASHYAEMVDAGMQERSLRRTLWIERAERYKMIEFIAREEGNLCNQMSWSRILRERTYGQWVDQLLRIANLANKLQNKCRAKAEELMYDTQGNDNQNALYL